jgi:hypothetical protein
MFIVLFGLYYEVLYPCGGWACWYILCGLEVLAAGFGCLIWFWFMGLLGTTSVLVILVKDLLRGIRNCSF